jgi:glutathione S-transferase
MAITFYTGSGSVPGWKVHLTLEYKQIPYELRLLSFQAGDLRKPEYLAVNPRGRTPAITDGDFALWESGVIVEYLEERWPERPVLPGDARARARLRRLVAEAQEFLGGPQLDMEYATFLAPAGQQDPARLARARAAATAELPRYEEKLGAAPFIAGESLTLADFTVYPIVAMIRRVTTRFSPEPFEFGPYVAGWMQRIEALPGYERTYPPHWRG